MKNFFEKHSIMVITCTILAIFVLGLFINDERSLSYVGADDYIYFNYPDWDFSKTARTISNKVIEIDYNILSNRNSKTNDYLIVADSSKQSIDYTGCYGNMYNSEGMLKSCLISSLLDIYTYSLFQEDENSNKNSVSLMTFNNNYNLIESYIDNSTAFGTAVRQIQGSGQANYEKALAGIRDFIEHYDKNRNLKVVVILNSLSIGDHEREKEAYRKLKEDYPNVYISLVCKSINNDNELEKVQGISDNIFFVAGEQVDSDFEDYDVPSKFENYEYDTRDILERDIEYFGFSAAIDAAMFTPNITELKLEDIINKDYLNFNNFKIIKKTAGEVAYNIVDGEPTITWSFNNKNPLQNDNFLRVQLSFNDDIEIDDDIPVSTKTDITYKIGDTVDTFSTTNTPYVRFLFNVIYDVDSLPANCVLENIPEEESFFYNEVVDLSNKIVSCDGYIFNNWVSFIPDSNILKYIDGDKFNMPPYDIWLTPNVGKINVTKKIDEYNDQVAYLDIGRIVNKKIKEQKNNRNQLNQPVGLGASNNYSIIRSDILPDNLEISNGNIISLPSSPVPVYMWVNNDTIYYYSTATKIYLNPDSSYIFSELRIGDISDLVYLDASKVKSFESAFYYNKLSDLNGISNWDVSSVTNMDFLFYYNGITNLDALSNWNVSNVKNMNGIFEINKFTNLDALSNWDVSNVEDMAFAFDSSSKLTNLDGISNWNVSKVKTMRYMFDNCVLLTNSSGINDWDVINVKDFSYMFTSTPSHPEFTKVTGRWNNGTFVPSSNGGN